MTNRSLIRRLERLEANWRVRHERYLRLEYYDRSPDGTLMPRPDSDDGTEATRTLRVIFVSAAAPHGNL